jgi:hypothetical protein
MTTAEERAEAREIAEAATAGPWESVKPYNHPGVQAVKTEASSIDWICSMQVANQPNYLEDAAHIAQWDPRFAQRVLAHIDELEAENARLRDDEISLRIKLAAEGSRQDGEVTR